jgi:fumarate reductase subunit D
MAKRKWPRYSLQILASVYRFLPVKIRALLLSLARHWFRGPSNQISDRVLQLAVGRFHTLEIDYTVVLSTWSDMHRKLHLAFILCNCTVYIYAVCSFLLLSF